MKVMKSVLSLGLDWDETLPKSRLLIAFDS